MSLKEFDSSREQELERAKQLFAELPSLRRRAVPRVTQFELEAITGIDQSTIAQLENGKIKTPETLIAHADRLIGLALPIQSPFNSELPGSELRKRNREYQANWRARHPEKEREQQEEKRKRHGSHERILVEKVPIDIK